MKTKTKQKAVKLIPPPGGRVHVLRVPVTSDRDWQEAITAAGPNTPADDNVRKVSDLYLPVGTGMNDEEFILVNLGPSGGSWDRAIEWGKQFKLERTQPRQVFAIGEHQPTLHRELKVNPMYVVATTECSFEGFQQACYMWWNGAGREADLRWLGRFTSARGWFAFSRKSSDTRKLSPASPKTLSALTCPHCQGKLKIVKA